MKGLVLFHRWVGIVMCLMFALWFLTGAVMVFVAFPSLPHSEAAKAAPVIPLAQVRLAPDQAARILAKDADLRLIQALNGPAYVGRGADGRDLAISAVSGAPLPMVTPQGARTIAGRFGEGRPLSVAGPFNYDQWIVHQQFDPLRPIYRVRLDDQRATDLYLSARTGEVLQRTRGNERAWNWLGSVIHWIYVVPIRRSFALWDWTVWILSLVGLTTAAVGLWLGVSRMQRKLRSARPNLSPFRGVLRWHHLLGLTGGVFLAAWIGSGWLSMDHGRLFSDGEASPTALAAYRNGDAPGSAALSAASLLPLQGASEIAFTQLAGRQVAAAEGPGPARVLISDPKGAAMHRTLPNELIQQAAQAGWPQDQFSAVSTLPVGHPYAKAEGLGPTARLVKLTGPEPMRLFVDGQTGKVLVAMTPSREAYAWAFYILHTYNYPGLSSRPVLRIVILMIPLGLGFALSVSGLIVGIRRLRLTAGAPKEQAPRTA